MKLLAQLGNLFRPAAERERSATLDALSKRLKSAERRVQEAYDQLDSSLADWERERNEILGGYKLGGRRGSRKQGDSWPYLRNIEDLNFYRAESRGAVDGNGYGAGMMDRAIDFVIGDGMQPSVTLRGAHKGAVATGVADADGDGRPDADPAVEAVQAVIDDFRRLNDWGCGEEDREEEGFRRSQRDGEVGVRFFAGGDANGIPLVRWIEPEQVDAPPGAEPHERWGIRTEKGDVETRLAYYLFDVGGTGGEWVDADEIVWHKLGTDRTVLRGMPQFWLVARSLYQSDRLNDAVAEVSAIQAQIAYVRQHAAGVLPNQITTFAGSVGDGLGVKKTPYGDKYRRVGFGEAGTVVDMSDGMTFQAGPVSQGVPGFVQALQSRLRQVCARFGYPEFFTGDASNGNYASLLAAGGPAERAFKRRQQKYAAFQAKVYRKACEYAVASGRLNRRDLAAVEIAVKPGKVSVSNNLEDAQIDQILIQNKVKSVQTVMQERGLDPRVESANLEAWDAKFGMGAMGLGGGGFGGEGGGADAPTFPGLGESVKREIGPPPFEGAVFDTSRHRWVKGYRDEDGADDGEQDGINEPWQDGNDLHPDYPGNRDLPRTYESEADQQEISRFYDDVGVVVDGWLNGQESKIGAEKLAEYAGSLKKAFRSLPPHVAKVAVRGVMNVEAYPSVEAITDAAARRGSAAAKDGKRVAGLFAFLPGWSSGVLHIDGGGSTSNIMEIYAHELGHAVDIGYRFSGTAEWKSAFDAEIDREDYPLSMYARTNTQEGFAEYIRLVSSAPSVARREYPKCWAFLKSKGLV